MAKLKNLHHYCVVKNCPNTHIQKPGMEFFTVPKELSKRKLWLKAAGQRLNKFGIKSVIYVCEEHFDLQNDMKNFRLKSDVIPHKRLNLEEIKKEPKHKQVEKTIADMKQQNIIYNKVDNLPKKHVHVIPFPVLNKSIPTIKKEKEQIIKEAAKGKIINIRDEEIKNKPRTVTPIRIQPETSKPKPAPQKIKNEIEFISVPVNRDEFCKETVSIRPQKPVKLQTCESCGKQFRHLNLHISSTICRNYWRRLENRDPRPKLVKIAPKPPIEYKVSFVPEQRHITITFNPEKMKTNTKKENR